MTVEQQRHGETSVIETAARCHAAMTNRSTHAADEQQSISYPLPVLAFIAKPQSLVAGCPLKRAAIQATA